MPIEAPESAPVREAELAFQADMLQQVSRTYALTIPLLPAGLREAVTNAYLLCRIADTIEDEPALDPVRKEVLLGGFTAAVAGRTEADAFAARLSALLSDATSNGERFLAEKAGRIVRIAHGLPLARRRAIESCLQKMTQGMIEFQRRRATQGLRDMAELERYCYHVAGVVAKMLTELFCDHSSAIAERREELMALAPSYGQGLQMTNILRDIWSDLARGYCWLPREPFLAGGFDVDDLQAGDNGPAFAAGLDVLAAATHRQLRQGLEFILLIPRRERGVRRHLLLTLGMAALTLRRIHRSEDFRADRDFNQPKRAAPALMAAITLLTQSDSALRRLFGLILRPVPR
ncbi:MAG: squalene/phytoene synthase family protein [Gammaproteobacteria bacterium]|nr:squalene/phytoene synthase family protein [Gammaproteobacteria bacterium]MYH85494.1 squalene/phytoene synthase family protein [Gammaproteobacteria bacterium]MYK06071.1 squalene/phytoene synthase family protein [Gammaproteobacteria bacterium]